MEAGPTDDEYLTRREADVILRTAETYNDAVKEAHDEIHDREKEAIDRALAVVAREWQQHADAHGREHDLHAEKHLAESDAVKTALGAVARERQIHAEAHEREHVAHQREHQLANLAIEKAERATDLRFDAANAFRQQINDMTQTMATKDSLDAHLVASAQRVDDLRAAFDRRYEELRASIVALEKGDVKQEGRGMGQGAMVAYIVTALAVTGSILGIIVVLSNLLTKVAA